VELTSVQGMLHWRGHAHKCLDVTGGATAPGTHLQIWDCSTGNLNQQFLFPDRHGPIRWAAHPHLCIHPAHGKAEVGNGLTLGHCKHTRNMQWTMPHGPGPIRLKYHSKLCIDEHDDNRAANGVQAKVGECPASDARTGSDRVWHRSGAAPSLYCVAVMMPGSYEQAIFAKALALSWKYHRDFGIFDCDFFTVFASRRVLIGRHRRRGPVHSVHFKQAAVGRSEDNTAANAQLFMNMWEEVRKRRHYLHHAWTVKLDPDAVFFPERLRGYLRPHTDGSPKFIKNCNLFPGAAGWPALWGSVEALSKQALVRYFQQKANCMKMPWWVWGEDKFLGNCLPSLGVGSVFEREMVGDGHCIGATCDSYHAAYHKYKSTAAWFDCWHRASLQR